VIRGIWQIYHLGICPGHSASPSLCQICAMSTADGFGHYWGKIGEPCVAVGLVTKTADVLTGLLYATCSLIGSSWQLASVVRRSVFGWRTLPDLCLTCDHFVGKCLQSGSTNQANSAFHPFGIGK